MFPILFFIIETYLVEPETEDITYFNSAGVGLRGCCGRRDQGF